MEISSILAFIVLTFAVVNALDARAGSSRLLELRSRSFTVLAVTGLDRLVRIEVASYILWFPLVALFTFGLPFVIHQPDILRLYLSSLVVAPVTAIAAARTFVRNVELEAFKAEERLRHSDLTRHRIQAQFWRVYFWAFRQLVLYRGRKVREAGQPHAELTGMKELMLGMSVLGPFFLTLIAPSGILFLLPALYSNWVEEQDLVSADVSGAWFFGATAVTAAVLVEGLEWVRGHLTRTPVRAMAHIIGVVVLLATLEATALDDAAAAQGERLSPELAGVLIGILIGASLAAFQDLGVAALASAVRLADKAELDIPQWRKPMDEWLRGLSRTPGMIIVWSTDEDDPSFWRFHLPRSTIEPEALAEQLVSHLYAIYPEAEGCATAFAWGRAENRDRGPTDVDDQAWALTLTVASHALDLEGYEATRRMLSKFVARPWRTGGWTDVEAKTYMRDNFPEHGPLTLFTRRGRSRTRHYTFPEPDFPNAHVRVRIDSHHGLRSLTYLLIFDSDPVQVQDN